MGIESYSTAAGSNNQTPPNGAPEGMKASLINNVIRQVMADMRTWFEDSPWVNLGYTHTYASATSFTIASTDVTGAYAVGRRIRAVGATTNTIYGTITASSFSTNTTVTVDWESGSLQSEALTIYLGAMTVTDDAIPYLFKKGSAVASASTTDIWNTSGQLIHVTGTTTITSFGTAKKAGEARVVIFDGALTLTHNASTLVLPGGQNITTAANDIALVWSDSTTKHYVVFIKNDGEAVTASVPAGATMSFAGTAAPTGWLFCYGQAVSRTTYADLFTAIGTTYGVGDGSTTFNLPDMRGRVVAGKDDMGGVSADRLTDQSGGLNGDTLGDTGGSETHTLTITETPDHAHASGASSSSIGRRTEASSSSNASTTTGFVDNVNTGTGSTGGGGAHNNVQPTIIQNYIIKT